MSVVLLNTVALDDGIIIKKGSGGGGGGIPINNQSKSVEFTENGTSEVRYDAGYTGLEKVSVKVAIPTEEKTVDITENGTTEVVAANGFLSKVVVNTNVASSGGGSDIPVIGDGKTYLYIKIAEKGRMDVPLYISQTVANGVTIDWGDGSAPQTLSGTGNRNTTHRYSDIGEYMISLNPVDGCTLGFGTGSYLYCVMGQDSLNSSYGSVYPNMLQAVEIGKNVTKITAYAFYKCYSLASVVISEGVTSIGSCAFKQCYALARVVIPNSVTSIGSEAFDDCSALASVVIPEGVTSMGGSAFSGCYSLASVVISEGVTSIGEGAFSDCRALARVVIPNSVTSIGGGAFRYCSALASVVIPEGVTSIGSEAFRNCFGVAFYDFSQCTSIPTLGAASVFDGIGSGCKIVVPDTLYDEWIAATNWSSHASKIVKASEFNA